MEWNGGILEWWTAFIKSFKSCDKIYIIIRDDYTVSKESNLDYALPLDYIHIRTSLLDLCTYVAILVYAWAIN